MKIYLMSFGVPTLSEIESAFNKLQANSYFDNYDLIFRKKIALFKNKHLEARLKQFASELKKKNPYHEALKSEVNLIFLPKHVKVQRHNWPHNFYTNTRVIDGNQISKPLIYCDACIEFHLVATIWIMRYGGFLEGLLPKSAYGNRLIIDRDTKEVVDGRSLFKPYFRQFQQWWANAIERTKGLLDNGENVSIINFDLKSFYHNVQFSFSNLEEKLVEFNPQILEDPIHKLLKRVHLSYKEQLTKVLSNVNPSDDSFPLPIGLLTSHVLANWYLISLDKLVEKKVRPVYYGRYVDDILLVVKDTLFDKNEVNEAFSEEGNQGIVAAYLKKYFSEIFTFSPTIDIVNLSVEGLENLILNTEKLFVYQFDAEYSPNLIESFVEEQNERVSMFKFLSDEEDEYFGDFDSQTFESNFDQTDANKARFKNLEDNKYKLSSFLSKLIKRRIKRGDNYRDEEVRKISRYFKSIYLIKHYYFWEKLFSLYVVYKKPQEIVKLVEEITNEINAIAVDDEQTEIKVTAEHYQNNLRAYLRSSIEMALGLNLDLCRLNKVLEKSISKNVYPGDEFGENKDLLSLLGLFRNVGLLRGAFVYYPLLQFTEYGMNTVFDLTSPLVLSSVIRNGGKSSINLTIPPNCRKFIPFRVKFWQTSLLIYYHNFLKSRPSTSDNMRYWFTDSFGAPSLLNEAFDLFYDINQPRVSKDILQQQYYQQFGNGEYHHRYSDSEVRAPAERSANFVLQELFLPNSGKSRERLRVALVNQYIDSKFTLESLSGKPNRSPERVEHFQHIWDELYRVSRCDMFIMAEMSLPYFLISEYVDQSARRQIAFTAGIEHINIHDCGCNFIITALPININGDKDVIPVLRLKNHYAPEEEEAIRDKRIQIPKPNPYRYDLFEWRGFYFSNYYCYELADVFHRSIFFSKIDVIFSSVWNLDTHYYNNIIDTATRDMHCYFVLANTSQYGFSKISRPRDFVNKEKVIVKGGTEDGYTFSLLVGDLKIAELRDFQLLDYSGQKRKNNRKKSFKPTPPDFDRQNVKKRINNERFFEGN